MIQLSILVPTFNYSKGIVRILQALTPLPASVELIISDDSTDTSVMDVVEQYAAENVVYKKNTPAYGAVENWNRLIECAKGRFIILLHHDELPLGRNFLSRLLAILRHTSSDVLMMDVLLLNKSLTPIRRHLPYPFRDFVIHYAPGYLFCRNVIGPTAALVVRKAFYPKFHNALQWLVDVELYYRLRQNTKRWATLRGLEIGSVQGDHETITETIQSQLKQLEQTERDRLSAAHPEASFWINLQGKPFSGTLEAAVWGGFRAVQITLSKLRTQKRPSE